MSLFESLYDEEGGDDASAPETGSEGEAAPAPERDESALPGDGLPEIEVPDDGRRDGPGADAGEDAAPVAELDIDTPPMSLQDFAAEMFDGSRPDEVDEDPAGDDPVAIDEPAASPDELATEVLGEHEPQDVDSGDAGSGFSSLFASGGEAGDVADDEPGVEPVSDGPARDDAPIPTSGPDEPATAKPAGSLASAASEIADLAKTPVATMAPPEDDEQHDEPDETSSGAVDGTDASDSSDGEIDFGVPLAIDDLLPSSKPSGGGTSLPSLSGDIPVKLIAVLLAAALVGFLGMRMLGGGSGNEASSASSPAENPEAALPGAPGSPAELLDRAQAAMGESELRNATLAAQAEYANTGTFARSASEWAALLPQLEVNDGADAAPARDVMSVVSSDHAACFETLLRNGTTVAAGVTAEALGFNQDPGGGSICTTDASVIEGWAPSLSGL